MQGIQNPQYTTIAAVAKLLRVSIEDLLNAPDVAALLKAGIDPEKTHKNLELVLSTFEKDLPPRVVEYVRKQARRGNDKTPYHWVRIVLALNELHQLGFLYFEEDP